MAAEPDLLHLIGGEHHGHVPVAVVMPAVAADPCPVVRDQLERD